MERNDCSHCRSACHYCYVRSRAHHEKDSALAGVARPNSRDPLRGLFIDAMVDARRATVTMAEFRAGLLADIPQRLGHVRSAPNRGHQSGRDRCPLSAICGRSASQ